MTWPGALSLATVTSAASAIAAGLVVGRADQREHRADVVGLGHQLAAQHDEAQRVVALEHAGGGERGQLAERVAGGGARRRGRARPSRRGWRRRWRAERSGWTRSARGKGSSPTSAMQRSSRSGARSRDEVPHLGCLAALAGEKRDRGSGVGDQGHTNTLSAGYEGSQRSRDNPPAGGFASPRLPPISAVVRARCGRLARASRATALISSDQARAAGPSARPRPGCARPACGTARWCAP